MITGQIAAMVLLSLVVIIISLGIYFWIRNNEVTRLRRKILAIIGSKIGNREFDYLKAINAYNSVSYNQMLHSFRPLTIHEWYNEYEIKAIYGDK